MSPDQSISWFRANRASLPQGPFNCYQLERGRRWTGSKPDTQVQFQALHQYATINDPAKFYAELERNIAAFESGRLSPDLATAYITRPIAQIRSALAHDARHQSTDSTPRPAGQTHEAPRHRAGAPVGPDRPQPGTTRRRRGAAKSKMGA